MNYCNSNVCAEIDMDDCNKKDAKPNSAGQLAHRFVHNFHVHDGEQTICGTCGDEKVCLRCNHVGKKECDVCGMWMNRRDFARHRRVHTGERPYKCAQCLASFKLKDHLVKHLRRHTGEKPFLCKACGVQFSTKHKLTDHQASIHSSARNHHCDECDKSYKLRYDLMAHKREVHGRVYTCRICNETLQTRNEYTAHCLIHSAQTSQADKKSDEVEDFKRGDSSKESDEAEDANTAEMSD